MYSLNLGLDSISPMLNVTITATITQPMVAWPMANKAADGEQRSHHHAGRRPHQAADVGEEETGDHDHAGVQIQHAFRIDVGAFLVHTEQELPERVLRLRRRKTWCS